MKNCGIWREEKPFLEVHLSIQLEQPVSSLKIKEFKEKSLILDALEMMKKDKHLKNLWRKVECMETSAKIQ